MYNQVKNNDDLDWAWDQTAWAIKQDQKSEESSILLVQCNHTHLFADVHSKVLLKEVSWNDCGSARTRIKNLVFKAVDNKKGLLWDNHCVWSLVVDESVTLFGCCLEEDRSWTSFACKQTSAVSATWKNIPDASITERTQGYRKSLHEQLYEKFWTSDEDARCLISPSPVATNLCESYLPVQ